MKKDPTLILADKGLELRLNPLTQVAEVAVVNPFIPEELWEVLGSTTRIVRRGIPFTVDVREHPGYVSIVLKMSDREKPMWWSDGLHTSRTFIVPDTERVIDVNPN